MARYQLPRYQKIIAGVIVLFVLAIVLDYYFDDDIVRISDPELREHIRRELNKEPYMTVLSIGDDIKPKDMEELTTIGIAGVEADNIKNLEGIEYATNLEELYLPWNKIKDLSPLSELEDLKELDLQNNNIEDITPIGDLQNLEKLNLFGNEVKDIKPLLELDNLEKVVLENNNLDLDDEETKKVIKELDDRNVEVKY
ncbi:leucine-rich repeat domain-containing protein [Natranaerobius thermophilus]|uniref:Leucine-rich repeat protein n=1 Tax=Natranaerobius thermophilus (strain ATCC BAA-1301 / DSM 18059 / JW/NM-WN-LF) TaxID=457570 RepID=B2A1W7_NATTJ|nr:leucine-rich repeat domain-containing protein [Natranaerobius thermophilus]ACB86164.1 hypothetical protein Nther_2608 [Natranaerobius thermophilus JW/NM-WN-LF]